MKKKFTFLIAAVMLLVFMTPSMAGWGQTRDVLFHETFGDNSGSARVWDDSYSVKSGVASVYSGITGYTVSNVKQGKNTTGQTKSGLNQSSQGTDAYIIFGPLNVLNYESLSVTYYWKAASVSGTYSTHLYYATSSNGTYTEVSGTGTGATSFVQRSYSLPEACQISTLYLKVIFNTSNTQAIIDEFELTGTASGGGGSSVATPEFSKGTSYCDEAQSITITCATDGATIHYTLDGTEPTSESTTYSEAISITETTTLKAIAIKDEESSEVASATYTFVNTLKTMQEIYNTATSSNQTVFITFKNWVVSGASSTYAYVTDGTMGLVIINYSGHGFAAGDILSGIAECTLNTYNGNARLANFTKTAPGLTTTTGGTVSPAEIAMADLAGVNCGALVSYNNLTCSVSSGRYYLSDGTTTIQVFTTLYSGLSSTLVNGKIYNITGVYVQSNDNKQICPRSANDIVPVITPATLPFNWAGGGKDALMALQGVTAHGLGSDYADANAPYLVKFDTNSDYILVKTDSQPDVVAIGVKKFGNGDTKIKVQGSVDGETFTDVETLTFDVSQNNNQTLTTQNSFGANVRYVKIIRYSGVNVGVGPISISKYVEKYTVNLADVSNGTISANKATAAEGETVTLTATPNTHYGFTAWSVYKTGDPETTITVTENQFTMPAYAVTVSATFTALTIRNINIPLEIEDKVIVDAINNQAYAGDEVTITVEAPVDQSLTSLTVTGNTSSDEISISPAVSPEQDEYTFTMPDENVTISATFGGEYTVTYSVNGDIGTLSPKGVTVGESITLATSVTPPTGFGFEGWTANANNTSNILTGSYTPTSDITLYAVYSVSTNKTYSFTISASDFNTTSYAANNNEKTTTARATTGETMDVKWTSNQIMLQSSVMQWQKDNGYIYNSTNLGTIQNVAVTSTEGTFTTYYGTSEQPESGDAGSGKGFFITSVGNATGKTSSVIVTFEKADTKYYTRVFSDETATGDITITGPTVIESDAVLDMGDYTLTNADPANLIIEDGGQLICNNSVQATVKKNIAGHETGSRGNATSGWNFIATTAADGTTPTTENGLLDATPANYDLYYYDEPYHYWRNYKESEGNVDPGFANDGGKLLNGKGYLYAKANDAELSFEGATVAANKEIDLTLSYSDAIFPGFNLVGNPFTYQLTSSSEITLNGDAFSAYYMIKNGEEIWATNISETPINPGTGFMVQANGESQHLVFNPNGDSRGERASKPSYIRIEAGNADFMDRAYLQFGQGNTLRKMTINDNVSHVYVMSDGKDYAAATIQEARGEMPVNFKAHRDGQYTITVNPQEVEMDYLHLIDNIAGVDVDLLANPSYSFNAKADDYESRFRLAFSANSENESGNENDNFAFISDGELIINGTGTLQVFDVLGRNVFSKEDLTLNAHLSTLTFKAGVYVLRLINGTDVKTQKIVVK